MTLLLPVSRQQCPKLLSELFDCDCVCGLGETVKARKTEKEVEEEEERERVPVLVWNFELLLVRLNKDPSITHKMRVPFG